MRGHPPIIIPVSKADSYERPPSDHYASRNIVQSSSCSGTCDEDISAFCGAFSWISWTCLYTCEIDLFHNCSQHGAKIMNMGE